MDYKKYIHIVEDFPSPGISFKDISPLLSTPGIMAAAAKDIAAKIKTRNLDMVVGIESRGFILGPMIAAELNVGFVMARKVGKLPPPYIETEEYKLEYGYARLCLPTISIKKGMRIHIHDDVLATGGTVKSVIDCLIKNNCIVDSCSFIIDLSFLNGAEKLKPIPLFSLIDY